jgi:hypothetical protein
MYYTKVPVFVEGPEHVQKNWTPTGHQGDVSNFKTSVFADVLEITVQNVKKLDRLLDRLFPSVC